MGDISQIKKFAIEMPKLNFAFKTDEYGVKIYFSSKGDIKSYEKDMLRYLRNPEAINNKRKFEIEKNRVVNESRNINHLNSLDLDDSKYNFAGVPEEIRTVRHEEFKNFVQNYIHPSNLIVTRYISDADPAKIKNYLNLLKKEYLDYFNYKDINVKYFLKNNIVYNKKLKNILDEGKVSDGKDAKKFLINVEFNFDSLNLNAKQRDVLSLKVQDDMKSKVLEYIYDLGYLLGSDFGILCDDSLDYAYLFLVTDKSELCKEDVIKKNLKKIIGFLKNYFKSFTDDQIIKNSNATDHLLQENDDLFLQFEECVAKYYLNYKQSDPFFDFVQKSFANHNNIFSNSIFNINKNNEILEDESSILKNIKENLDVFDILDEKGPTKIAVYQNVLRTEEEMKRLNKKNDLRSSFFVPIKLENYNDRTLFNFVSAIFRAHLSDIIGHQEGLIYNNIHMTGLEDSNIIGYCFENVFAENDVTDYIYKNFNKIINDFELREEVLKKSKEKFKEQIEIILKDMNQHKKKYEILENLFSAFLKGEYTNRLNKDASLSQLKNLIRFIQPYDNLEYLYLKDLEFIKKLNSDENKFNKRYEGKVINVTKEMVKDYKELVFNNYYNLFKYSINFYKDILKKVGNIKFDDVLKVIKSVSLVKKDELKKENKQLKSAFGFDDK